MAARRWLLLALLALAPALSGCLTVQSDHGQDFDDDGCWMFCGGDSYDMTFVMLPALFVLLVVGAIVAIVLAIVAAARPPQQVIIRQEPPQKGT